MKKVAIMQPYFLPYVGYWQLIAAVDEFVIYDNIQYTKKGWFNRNRILTGSTDKLFIIPVKKDSDYLPVNQRYLSDDSEIEINRILRVIESTYKKVPYFTEVYPIIESCFRYEDKNLFNFIYHSVQQICDYLDIKTKISVSSTILIDHNLKGVDKVVAITKATGATTYINAIGGRELYDVNSFAAQGLELKFIQAGNIEYEQFGQPFVPWLSIIDLMMFNDRDSLQQFIKEYTLA